MAQQSLGDRLKQARREMAARLGRDVTQADVAAALGVTGVTVSRYESGLNEPTLAVIRQLAAFLGADPGYLAFGPPDPPAVAGRRPPADIDVEGFGEGRIPERPRAAAKRTRDQAG